MAATQITGAKKGATAGKSKPRTQEERRRATQDAILKAAIDLLAEQGYARFSTIAVAKRAHVSRGARENYFPSKNDLIAAAWRAALDHAEENARKLAHDASGADSVGRFLDDSESFFLSHTYMALLELQVAARTDATLSKLFHRLYVRHRRSHDAIWIDAMTGEGYRRDRIESFIRSTQYLMRGMAMTSVWQDSKSTFRTALREWREHAPHYLTLDSP